MKKLIEISECRECPEVCYTSSIPWCGHIDIDSTKDELTGDDDIPDWCPLPTAPEGT